MARLLQWFEPFGEEIDRSDLEETVSLAIEGLKERFKVAGPESSKLEVLGIKFAIDNYRFDSELGSAILSRVSAVHPNDYEGDRNKFGFGLDGMGTLVETAHVDGTGDLIEDIAIEVESAFGEYGAGLVEGSVEKFLGIADEAKMKNKSPLLYCDYVHFALRLEASKGPFMNPDRYEALRVQALDSISRGSERGVIGSFKDAYVVLKGKYTVLKRKLEGLK